MPPIKADTETKNRAMFTQEDRKIIMLLWKEHDPKGILFLPGRTAAIKEKKDAIREKIVAEVNSIRPEEAKVSWKSVSKLMYKIQTEVKEAGDLQYQEKMKAFQKASAKTGGGPLDPFDDNLDPDEVIQKPSAKHNANYIETVDADTLKLISNRAQVPNEFQLQIPEVRHAGDFMSQFYKKRAEKELARTHTNTSAGSISGTSAGSISGTLAGSISGTSAGSISGTLAGSISGTSAGSISSASAGSISSASAGSISHTSAGSISGTSAGSSPSVVITLTPPSTTMSSVTKSSSSSTTSSVTLSRAAITSASLTSAISMAGASNSTLVNSGRKRKSSTSDPKTDKESINLEIMKQTLESEQKRARLELLRIQSEINLNLFKAAILKQEHPKIVVQAFPVAEELKNILGDNDKAKANAKEDDKAEKEEKVEEIPEGDK